MAAGPRQGLDELLEELDALIGLQRVKREIHRQVALLRVERLRVDAGLRSPTLTRHLVFTGNPGTGKTTVARLVSGIYQALGLLSRGHLVEVDRSELVAGYLGQTATKTADVVASAAGGVLFIDEAYSLTGGGDGGDQYGQESVDTLVKEMEDRRDDLVVIVAGYPAPMAAFIAANPGLASRFRTTIEFEDYTDDELVAILEHLASGADYELEPDGRRAVPRGARPHPAGSGFGNGRFARNALEAAIGHHAWRLRETAEPTVDQLRRLVARDFDEEPLDEGASTPVPASHAGPAPADHGTGDRTPDPEAPRDDPAPGPDHAGAPPGSGAPAPRRRAGAHAAPSSGHAGPPPQSAAGPPRDSGAGWRPRVPRSGPGWQAPRGGCGPWASSASPRPCCSASRRGRPSGPRTAPWPVRRRTQTSSCASRPSRPASSRRMPTPPTPSSSEAWSRRPSATTTPAAISSASLLIAEAAQHQPADGNALGALNQALIAYTSQVEQARANNRQALPIGAQYLKEASADLRATALPLLKNLGEANNARVAEEFDRAARAALWLVVPGLLTLLVLGLALVWLARRTRRYVNLPLAAAALVVLVTLVVGTVGLLAVKQGVDTTREGVYAATLSTAQARIAGFDAKSNESLTLIARGSGGAFEKAWQASSTAVRDELADLAQNPASSGLSPMPWSEYAGVHQQIRALDDGGNWDAAVTLATGTEPGTGNATFAAFDASSDAQLSGLSGQTAQQLDDARGWLPVAGALGVLAGVVAAFCTWWGVSLRLEEYR